MSTETASIDFADDVLHALERADWSQRRRVVTSLWIAPLEREGYRSFPLARDFLERFGGLVLLAPPRRTRAFNPGRTLLDPLRAAAGEFDRVDAWQKDHGLTLFPVGHAFDDYFILMIDPDEVFYAGNDQSLLRLAAGTPDCFRQLLFAPRAPEILEDERDADEGGLSAADA